VAVKFFDNDQRKDDVVFIESEESVRVREENACIQNVSSGQSSISWWAACRQASTLVNGKARISPYRPGNRREVRLNPPGNC
jgi:hypothetical protein